LCCERTKETRTRMAELIHPTWIAIGKRGPIANIYQTAIKYAVPAFRDQQYQQSDLKTSNTIRIITTTGAPAAFISRICTSHAALTEA